MANTFKAATVILFGLYFTTTDASPTQIPKTIVDPSHCDHTLEDQNLPDDSDCSKYYRCVYGKKVPKICPEKMLFNPDIGNCDLYYNVECTVDKISDDYTSEEQDWEEAIEHLTGKSFIKKSKVDTTMTDAEDGATLEGTNVVAITKPGDNTASTKFVYIPHEYDQSAYYKIQNGEWNLLNCEDGMVFSIDLEICARPWDFE